MLNSVINVDLHIHSAASKYKDGSIVSEGDIAHLGVLFKKLEENDINLISITDHNRFDSALYKAINQRIGENPDGCVKAVLPGVEFDVRFEEDKIPCHVIAIFNVKDWEKDSKAIECAINSKRLTDKDDAYSVDEFEALLKKTGLDSILIAHQHEGLMISPKKKHSLSNSTSQATEMLLFGYIDAVEYNNSKVQGILLDEFHQLELPTSAIIGSDCHSWDCYPAHDKDQNPKMPFSTRIKCLPSFQGLLLAFTSPDTRFQVPNPQMKQGFVSSFSYGANNSVPLSPGLNAIIGENGSGKSSLIELLINSKPKDKWITDFKTKHVISCDGSVDPSRTVWIKQGQLRANFNDGTLFDQALFGDIDHEKFERDVRNYSAKLKARVKRSLEAKKHRDDLSVQSLRIDPNLEGATFNVSVITDEEFTNVENEHSARYNTLTKLVEALQTEISSGYYTDEELRDLHVAFSVIKTLRNGVSMRKADLDAQIALRNAIHLEIEKYNTDCGLHATEIDSRKKEYRDKKRAFAQSIINVLADTVRVESPISLLACAEGQGISKNLKNGFLFQTTAKYASASNLSDGLLKAIFNKDYQSISSIMTLDTSETVSKAVSGSNNKAWETRWDAAVEKYIEEMEATDSSILDHRDKSKIGSTFGEQSLTYYKYKSFNQSDWDLLLVDQPEDDISHSRINSELISYLNSLRSTHQVVMVTHNPLLVVNLDVDNVIVLEENTGKLEVTSGCLESKNVLEKVAEHMDGGKSAIRRRLRAYETPNEC